MKYRDAMDLVKRYPNPCSYHRYNRVLMEELLADKIADKPTVSKPAADDTKSSEKQYPWMK